MSKEEDKKLVIEGFQKAKHFMIAKVSTVTAGMIIKQVLEIEDFPSTPDTIHAVEEQMLLKACFAAHASAIDSAFNTVIRMIEEGVLVGDVERTKILAENLASQSGGPSNDE